MLDTPTISADVPCAGCQYNLRTVPLDGRCPECGKPVRETLPRSGKVEYFSRNGEIQWMLGDDSIVSLARRDDESRIEISREEIAYVRYGRNMTIQSQKIDQQIRFSRKLPDVDRIEARFREWSVQEKQRSRIAILRGCGVKAFLGVALCVAILDDIPPQISSIGCGILVTFFLWNTIYSVRHPFSTPSAKQVTVGAHLLMLALVIARLFYIWS